MRRLMSACAWVAGLSLLADVVHVLMWPGNWRWVGWGIPLSALTVAWALLTRRSAGRPELASASITAAGRLEPGSVLVINQGTSTAERVRVTATSGGSARSRRRFVRSAGGSGGG